MRRLLLALLTCPLALTACGGSSSDDALSKDALVKKVDAICAKASSEGKGIQAPASLQDANDAAAYFDQVAPITDRETKALVALKPADDVKADYKAFTDAQVAANDVLQKVRKKADAKDASGLQDLKDIGPLGQKVTDTAKKLGSKRCA